MIGSFFQAGACFVSAGGTRPVFCVYRCIMLSIYGMLYLDVENRCRMRGRFGYGIYALCT